MGIRREGKEGKRKDVRELFPCAPSWFIYVDGARRASIRSSLPLSACAAITVRFAGQGKQAGEAGIKFSCLVSSPVHARFSDIPQEPGYEAKSTVPPPSGHGPAPRLQFQISSLRHCTGHLHGAQRFMYLLHRRS